VPARPPRLRAARCRSQPGRCLQQSEAQSTLSVYRDRHVIDVSTAWRRSMDHLMADWRLRKEQHSTQQTRTGLVLSRIPWWVSRRWHHELSEVWPHPRCPTCKLRAAGSTLSSHKPLSRVSRKRRGWGIQNSTIHGLDVRVPAQIEHALKCRRITLSRCPVQRCPTPPSDVEILQTSSSITRERPSRVLVLSRAVLQPCRTAVGTDLRQVRNFALLCRKVIIHIHPGRQDLHRRTVQR
jgi:hypothetical protein